MLLSAAITAISILPKFSFVHQFFLQPLAFLSLVMDELEV